MSTARERPSATPQALLLAGIGTVALGRVVQTLRDAEENNRPEETTS